MVERAISGTNSHAGSEAQPYAIVVGLDSLTGLQTARILRDRGIPVIGVAGDPRHWACYTNACERLIVTSLTSDKLIEELEGLGPTLAARAVLVPCSDVCVMNLSAHRQRLSDWFHLLLPDHETVRTLSDKLEFVEFALANELPIPKTFLLRRRQDVVAAAQACHYPCVLKPALRSAAWDAGAGGKVLKIASATELVAAYDRVHDLADTLIVQEWVEGTDAELYSCNCYFDRASQPLVSFVARKIRQWPPVVGISCLGEEVRNDAVRDATLRLFAAARYQGLGYVEMKRDTRTGEHFIIEPNIGRPTGRSAIAEGGGVELLYTMYCDAVQKALPSANEQQFTGVKWIYLRQDLRSAFHYWRRGELSFGDWVRSLRGRKVFAVASWRDPKPFVADLIVAMRKSREARRKGRKRSSASVRLARKDR